jgi:hypothetical protein
MERGFILITFDPGEDVFPADGKAVLEEKGDKVEPAGGFSGGHQCSR